MISLAMIVDWGALLKTAIASLVAALVVTLSASTAIYGVASFAEARREDRNATAAVAASLGLIGLLVFAGTIAAGLFVMISD